MYEEMKRGRERDSQAAATAQTTEAENFIVMCGCTMGVTNVVEDGTKDKSTV